MDPASVVGVLGVIGQIIKAIYQYGDAVKECKTEVARLRAELFGMQAALAQVEHDVVSSSHGSHLMASPNLTSQESRLVLDEAGLLLDSLYASLKQSPSTSGRVIKQLAWPLKRQHVIDTAASLERLKTYFILAATNDSLLTTRETLGSVHQIRASLDNFKASEAERRAAHEAIQWLSPLDSEMAHTAALSARSEGTNAWFLDTIFQPWATGNSRLLWLKNKPGSGKTCLTAACADRTIQASLGATTAYFYCSHNSLASQEPQSILASFVTQMYQCDPRAQKHVLSAYHDAKASRRGKSPDADVSLLIQILARMCGDLKGDVFLFVDAIDECAQRTDEAVNALLTVAAENHNVKLMLSSTEVVADSIVKAAADVHVDVKAAGMDPTELAADISTFIQARFKIDPKLSRLPAQLQRQIQDELQSKHNGSFRWTQCTLDDLTRLKTPRSIREALKRIPPSLSEIYTSILNHLPRELAEMSHLMLQYMVASLRPLTLQELAEAVAFSLSDEFDEDDRLLEPELAVQHLRSLVRYDHEVQRVELAHSSVRLYLTSSVDSSEFYIRPAQATTALSHVCIGYLALPAFSSICADKAALCARKTDWPFFEYASFFWTRHLRVAGSLTDQQAAKVMKFVGSGQHPGENNFAAWYQCVYPQGSRDVWFTQPLYMCAREGLIDLLKIIIATGDKSQLETPGGARCSTPLHVAASYGENEAVKLLLAAGADPNESNLHGESGIQWASYWGNAEGVEALLAGGADPSLLDRNKHAQAYSHIARFVRYKLNIDVMRGDPRATRHRNVASFRYKGSGDDSEKALDVLSSTSISNLDP